MSDQSSVDLNPKLSRREFIKATFAWLTMATGVSGVLGVGGVIGEYLAKILNTHEPVSPFKNEGQKIASIQATQTASDSVEDLKINEIPENAINNSVRIEFFLSEKPGYSGSGTTFTFTHNNERFWAILTAGHIYLEAPEKYDNLLISREDPLPGPKSIAVHKFGIAAIYSPNDELGKSLDIGIIVIPENQVSQFTPKDKILSVENLELSSPLNPDQEYSVVAYPQTKDAGPSYGLKMQLDVEGSPPYAPGEDPMTVVFKNVLMVPGASGAGIFSKTGKLVAVLTRVYGHDNQYYYNSIQAMNLSVIGKTRLEAYISAAMTNLESKQASKP